MLSKLTLSVAVIILVLYCISICNGETLKIGAIFDTENPNKDKAFHLAIQEINSRRSSNQPEIEPIVVNVPLDNPFEAMSATCSLIEKGVVAILGPSSEDNSNVVQSVCDNIDIPHLDVRWDDSPINPIINFYPYQNMLTQVYIDLITQWNFREFVVLYEDNESLKRVGEILKLYDNKGYKIVVRQLDKMRTGNYRPVLKEVWRSETTHLVLDCSIEILEEVLRQAQQVGLMTNKQNYIITNLDFHTLNLIPYQYGETNITGMRFIDPENEVIRSLALEIYRTETSDITFGYIAAWKLQLETALVMDAVMMFGEALKELPKTFVPPSLNCESKQVWTFGTTLINLVKGMHGYPGLTGKVRFDVRGFRSDFGLEILELREGGITVIGNWTTSEGLNISRPTSPRDDDDDERSLANKHFRVITCLTEPYGMHTESLVPLYGNDRYEGFAIDLIAALAEMEGFNYTFIIREDKKNGKLLSNGSWEGMIADVINNVADLAITDLTITAEREAAVDFTTPFMNLGISILYQKPRKAPPSFFSFADPFALDVWKLLAASFIGVSLSLFVLGRICPSEWTNPYPCIEDPDFLVNQLSLRNCFWFSTGSLMQQGSEIAPIAISTRMVAGMWWFFTLIMVSSYTANLAAFLTTESPDIQFNNVFELVANADKKGIKYGAKRDGATEEFFKNSKHVKEYKAIWQYMRNHYNNVMVQENDLGVDKAERQNESYAFFMENTSIEYQTQRRCNLTKVGSLLDEKGYGIAMRKNSTYRNTFNTAILKLQENGKMDEMRRKWWEEKRGGGQCTGDDKTSEATPLNLKNVGGVFWVTIGGTVLSCLFVFVEMPLHMMKVSIKTKQSLKKLIIDELKFYFKFSGTIKPVKYNNSEENSSKSSEEEIPYDPGNKNEKF